MSAAATRRRVAVLGARYDDLAIEQDVLAPLGVELVRGWGGDADEIVAAADGAEVILAGSAPRFTGAVLERLPACRGVVRAGVGVESVDLDAARALGVWVANVPDGNTEAVAVHALTLALAGVRRLGEADRLVRSGGWGIAALRPLRLPSALTAGVVGYGRIGRRTAELLAGVGFRVIAHDPLHAESVPLDELLGEADVVSLHVPGNADGSPLLGATELALLKPEAVLVNTARGSLVDLDALVAAMAGGGGPRVAALDVFAGEPPALDVLEPVADRLILSPHMGWYTQESEARQRRGAAEEAARLLRGERPRAVVVEGADPSAPRPAGAEVAR